MIALLALLLQDAPAAVPAPAPPKAYVSRFCAPIAMSEADPAALRQHYAEWRARVEGDEAARAFRPDDVETPGQMVAFADAAAPHVFIDRRRGACSLVYAEAHAPQAALDDLKSATLRLNGGRTVNWRRVTTKRVGPPGPIRYFLPASDEGRFGLCATLFEDLRLHDATPATVVRVEACRLGGDETPE